MIHDEEIKKCKEYLKDKECDMCKKIVRDCGNQEGIYKQFSGHKIKLIKVDDNYISMASALIRSHPVCQKHFRVLKKDNDKRHVSNMEISKDLELIKYRRSDL